MPPIRLRAVRLASTGLIPLLLWACEPNRPGAANLQTPACPGFKLTAQDIAVTPAGNSFPLSDSNATRIEFPAGAVSSSAQYHIAPLTRNGKLLAGFTITPTGSAPSTFPRPVKIVIGYNECSWADSTADFYIARFENGVPKSIGGGKDTVDKSVEAGTNHFSDYAIAM